MTLFFSDLNVWLALSVPSHTHSADAWNWMNSLPGDGRLVFSRYTQIGLLRLLTNTSIMGEQTMTLSEAWDVYDRWLEDPRVDFYPEPRGGTESFASSRNLLPPSRRRRPWETAGCSPLQVG